MKDIIHVCKECNKSTVEVFSIEKIKENTVKIKYVCSKCGNMKEEIHYLYEK